MAICRRPTFGGGHPAVAYVPSIEMEMDLEKVRDTHHIPDYVLICLTSENDMIDSPILD